MGGRGECVACGRRAHAGTAVSEVPARLAPLVDQFDWACERLTDRMTGPDGNAGGGTRIPVPAMTDAEYLWEPVPGCWSIRRRADGPGEGATSLAGAGEWGRDRADNPQPYPPPFTTIAWRLGHLSEMMAIRADHMDGSHSLMRTDYRFTGHAAEAISDFSTAAAAWRGTLLGTDGWTRPAAVRTPMAATRKTGSSRQPGG